MAAWTTALTAAELNKVMTDTFPGAAGLDMVRAVSPGRVTVVFPFAPGMLRPGGVISGPQLMSIADTAAYVLLIAHVGPEMMAVTSTLTMNFLRGAKPGDMVAEAELLSLGRRLAVCDVRVWTEAPDRPAAQASVTYARAQAA
ncbi:MAG TPA: PaaI family thioesterase [Caulobacteraceae bacterium]|jgi:uncharacterized protein (TIGR00369 family)